MQLQIDETLLNELGITGLDEDDKNALLASLYKSLNLRMGMRIAEVLGEDKLTELNKLTDAGKDQEAQQWIKDNVPNYQDIAKEELDKFKQEIKDTSANIMNKAQIPEDN